MQALRCGRSRAQRLRQPRQPAGRVRAGKRPGCQAAVTPTRLRVEGPVKRAAVPREVYRLKRPSLEIVYRRKRSELKVEISDIDVAQLSGSHAVAEHAEPDLGMRVDAELAGPPRKVMLTLLLPELSWHEIVGESADVNGAAIITRVLWVAYDDRAYPRQSYDVRELRGTTSMEV